MGAAGGMSRPHVGGASGASDDAAGLVPCIGCGAFVPDVTWPVHRYIGASPGCWAIYAETIGGGLFGPIAPPWGPLMVDAYASSHPGEPGPQSTPSVWIHLIALQLVLEAGWPTSQLVRIRALAADMFDDWGWLGPPDSMGDVTIVDLDEGSDGPLDDLTRRWVEGVWAAWAAQHERIRTKAAELLRGLD